MTTGELTAEITEGFKQDFYSTNQNRLAQNVCTRSDPLEACLNRRLVLFIFVLLEILRLVAGVLRPMSTSTTGRWRLKGSQSPTRRAQVVVGFSLLSMVMTQVLKIIFNNCSQSPGSPLSNSTTWRTLSSARRTSSTGTRLRGPIISSTT